MKLLRYRLYVDHVDLYYPLQSVSVSFSEHSGIVYQCSKDLVTHVGIYLGRDQFGRELFLHNHPRSKCSEVVDAVTFARGESIVRSNAQCTNPPLRIIEIGLQQILAGEPYALLTNNCETFANMSCKNNRTSPTVNKVLAMLWIGVVVGGIAWANDKNKS